MDRAALFETERLDAWYGQARILHGVDMSIRAGEVVVLLGRNGAGKTTTMRAIMGLGPRVAGSVRFRGTEIAGLAPHRIARLGLGYVPEDRRIFTGLTVAENLEVGRLPARSGRAWTPEALYELFPNLAQMRTRRGGEMSGGEQQMLTIARSLMGNPEFLLLDEPSEGLAPVIIEGIAAAMARLKGHGVAMLLSEQNLHFARLVADRATIIERGAIRYSGTIAELDRRPDVREQYLSV